METKLIRCIEVGRSQSGQPIIHILAANADGIEIYADDKDFVTIPQVFYKCDRLKETCVRKYKGKCDSMCHNTSDIRHAKNFEKASDGSYFETDNEGEWIPIKGALYKCEKCGYQSRKTVGGRPYYHYCPMCGQKKPATFKDFSPEQEGK